VRVLLLSDIHSNLVALEAILAHAEGAYDGTWVTGDIVGYGPDPDGVVQHLLALGAVCVAGNHDVAACGLTPLEAFNPLARTAVDWTQQHMSESTRTFLAALPRVRTEGEFTLVHGTLRDPIWEYMTTYEAAEAHLRLQATPYSIVGHTHHQMVASLEEGEVQSRNPDDGETVHLAGGPVVINAGSAGQPRDRDPRVGYAMVDTAERRVQFFRVPYDIAETQARMRGAGLPELLAVRLELGR
jgi:diadenosine tetraphosphatase ApaH/serine/threonine PP2A family protein phosphatase